MRSIFSARLFAFALTFAGLFVTAGRAERGLRGDEVPVRIELVSRLGPLFELQRADIEVDGRPLEVRPLQAVERQVLIETSLPTGHHELLVDVAYAGQGGLLYSYLDEYRFIVVRHISFTAGPEGALVQLLIDESGGLFTELAEQPSLAYRVEPLNRQR